MATNAFHTYLKNSYTFVVICHELDVLVNIGCSRSVSSWLRGITSLLVCQRTKTGKAYVVDRRKSKEHSAINAKEHIQFPFPVLPNSPVASSIWPQSSYARHDRYRLCGYILCVPKRSSSFDNNLLYYLHISMCIIFLPACLNTKSCFPDCRKKLSWSGKYFSSIDIFHFPPNLFYSPAVNG